MASEDGKMQEYSMERFLALVENRDKAWAQMMKELPERGYEVIPVREEAGFTARLAVKAGYPDRGIVLVCAGGGFRFKSQNEALPVAEYFYRAGINTAILDYHVKSDGFLGIGSEESRMAGDDGLAAVRYLRANAKRFEIDPTHIAIGGFSAGGILSGYTATKFDYGDDRTPSSRPDAALILYGAFSATSSVPQLTGGMTRQQIAQANRLDNIRNIRTDCPPMFVFQTHEDDPRIALNFCMELAVHGVPYEIHTFEDGPHGGGLYDGKNDSPNVPHTAMWAPLAVDWLQKRGF